MKNFDDYQMVLAIECECGETFKVDDLKYNEWHCPYCKRVYRLMVENKPKEEK